MIDSVHFLEAKHSESWEIKFMNIEYVLISACRDISQTGHFIKDISQACHFIDRRFHRQAISQTGHFIDMDILYTGHLIDIDISQTGHFIDRTFHRQDSSQTWTFNRQDNCYEMGQHLNFRTKSVLRKLSFTDSLLSKLKLNMK